MCLHICLYCCVRFKRCVALTLLLKDFIRDIVVCLCSCVIVALIRLFYKGMCILRSLCLSVCVCVFVFVKLRMHTGSVDGYIVNVLKAPWVTHDELPAA